ncbi:MAG: cytochrome-c peroxidase [Candidatus Sericytochromatia bacterium]
MNKKLVFSLSILLIAGYSITAYSSGISVEDKTLLDTAKGIFKPLPSVIDSPKSNLSTPDKVKLGKKLFFEKELSMDKSMSCNTCHQLESFGAENRATSIGFKKHTGSRNSPSVYNAGLHFTQFWDGRAKDLEEQAGGSVLNPGEMAMPNEKVVLERLSKHKEYPSLFKKVFGTTNISYDELRQSIAAFERTLVTPSRFDKYLKGDINALTVSERQGLRTFVNKGCISCHNGVAVGGGMFQKFGVVNPYQFQKDLGRFEVTKKEEDKYVFKVPSLRNVANTSPYFHDGKVKTLKEAIKTMGKTQLGLNLTAQEINSIETFLKSLTGQKPKI